jgi:hypothetical protein
MRAYRQATDGVTLRNNDRVLSAEEINLFDTTMQALGLPTAKLADRQRVQSLTIKTGEQFAGQVSELKKDYAAAVRSGDSQAVAEIRTAWKELQDAQKRNGFTPIPLSSLLKAPVEQQKRERGVVGGVETKKSDKGFVAAASSI